MSKKTIKKVVLAYSGGLDTSAIIPWIKENYCSDVIAFVADIGQSQNDLHNIKEKALQSGASECIISDLKEEFVENYIYPILKTGALYEGSYLLGTAIARPIIAKAQVELALKLNADGLCHGATGKGNDQVRFETTYVALAPNLKVIAPWREWNLRSREELLLYLKERNIKTTATIEKIYSRDENAWHISTEGGILEDPWNRCQEDCWVWTVNPKNAPDISDIVSLKVKRGCIVAVNNVYLTPFQCLNKLNKIGSKHGIGRIDIIENRLIGMKSRGCYETPGGTIMFNALRAIEQLVLDKDSFKWRQILGLEMSYIIYNGNWFSPVRKSLQASATELSLEVNGEVVLELYKGTVTPIQKYSPNSLYSKEFATFGLDNVYHQSDAHGFIKLFSLPSRIRAMNSNMN
ncbi:argininosuccinate synthase [Buchnera aphidicola (Melaphis rhois)]|uniref:Argininosuccinate synthase n=1 Tax=Buchnera aphidicola subsp. Melaphis rhois TaxID=118103 RepID=A0A4D6Y309_BUCMH|nr:argininosuccinate synthase [Buchnera aphidicola]QCI23557.1 argininosuccinate synthase [Buchnera aphidicola (Melaphis rhois)]